MKKIIFNIVLLILLIVVLTGCGSVKVKYIGSKEQGYFEVIMNYNLDSDYHMGQLYGEALVTQCPTLEAGFANYFSSLSTDTYNTIMARIQQIKNQIPREHRDFINGFARKFSGGTTNSKDDGKLSVDELLYFSLIGDIHRSNECSIVAVYGAASDTGKPLIGRLLDWSKGSHGAVYYIRKGNKKIINIGTSVLSQSVSTALNQHGIFVATLDAPTGEAFPDLSSNTYYSYHFDLRYALENFGTIEEITSHLNNKAYTFNHLVAIGDNITVKVLENNLNGSRTLRESTSLLRAGVIWEYPNAIAAVNAFLLPENYDNFSMNPFNTLRWKSIREQMSLYYGAGRTITDEEMKLIATYYGTNIDQLTDGVIMNSLTQQIVIYDSFKSSLKIFFRNNRTPGSANTASTFDVDHPDFWNVPVHY